MCILTCHLSAVLAELLWSDGLPLDSIPTVLTVVLLVVVSVVA
jgi:hypothetical protein